MDRILGQPRAVETLRAGLRSGRLHHAWIFAGPRGVGKYTAAVEFAKILLDPDAVDAPNPESETARRIDSGAHPDFHVVRKELALYSDNAQLRARKLLNIPLDVLREYVIGGQTGDGKYQEAPAYRTSTLGHGKVFVIDEAELVDPTGQNALLKTLEEPPAKTYIILVTSRPQRLLATIHSRCQLVAFGPLDDDAMAQWIDRSGLAVGGAERAWILRFARGAPGVAQLAAEYGFYEWQTSLDPMLEKLAAGGFPAELGQRLAELVESFANAWVKAHDNASKDAANKDGARFLLSILAAYADQHLAETVQHGRDTERWTEAIEVIAAAERQLYANLNMKMVLENLVVQWWRAGQGAGVA